MHLPGWWTIIGIVVPVVIASGQSLTVRNVPSSIDQNAEAAVDVVLQCPGCDTDSFLRGVFYPSGTNYFGFTQTASGTWVNAPGSLCNLYYKVGQTDLDHEGTWSGILKVKPDPEHSYYNGPGNYLFKVGRYTPSCNSASVWSNEVPVTITGPTSTPTPQPTVTQPPTLKPTTPPTNTVIPTATVYPTAPPTVTTKPTRKLAQTPSPAATRVSAILGISDQTTEATAGAEAVPAVPQSQNKDTSPLHPVVIALSFIGSGLGLMAAVIAWNKSKLWKNDISPDE